MSGASAEDAVPERTNMLPTAAARIAVFEVMSHHSSELWMESARRCVCSSDVGADWQATPMPILASQISQTLMCPRALVHGRPWRYCHRLLRSDSRAQSSSKRRADKRARRLRVAAQ